MTTQQRHIKWLIVLGGIVLMASSCAPPPPPSATSSALAQTPSSPTFRVQAIYFAEPEQQSQTENARLITSQSQQELLSRQLDDTFAQAAAHIHAGDALLDDGNPLEAIREYERARIIIEQQIDPVIVHASSEASIQGESYAFSTSKIQAANVLRTDMLSRVNRSYDLREMYAQQQRLDKINQLRSESQLQLKSIPVASPDQTMTRTIQQRSRIEQLRPLSNVSSQRFAENVERYVVRFQRRGDDFSRCLLRADQYFPHVTSILVSEKVPEYLAYVALIESGYQPLAKSSSDEAGLWLLSPFTARRYGLRVNASTDERLDVDASTRAFARYMRDQYYRYGSWERAIIEYAPEERDYLAKLNAAMNIANNPQRYGFHVQLSYLAGQTSLQSTEYRATVFLEPPIGMGTTY